MKTRFSVGRIFIIVTFLAGAMSIIPQHLAYAKCGGQYPPCPPPDPGKSDYSKKNQATDVPPTKTPIPTATQENTQDTSVLIVPTQPECLPPPFNSGNSPAPTSPVNSSFFDLPPLLLGGGGIFLGILIGLLLGGIFRGSSRSGGGIFMPTNGQGELLPAIEKADKWDKANAGIGSGGDRSVNGDGEPAGFDVFHKQSDAASAYDAFNKTGVNAGFDVFKKYKKADEGDGSFFIKGEATTSNNMGKQDLNSIRESPLSPDKSSLPGEDINGDIKL